MSIRRGMTAFVAAASLALGTGALAATPGPAPTGSGLLGLGQSFLGAVQKHQYDHDQMEIGRLLTTYAWAVDSKDIDSMMSIFSEDAQYDLSAYSLPPAVGKAAIRNVFLYGVFPVEKCSFSSITNFAVDIAGKYASGGDYFMHYGYYTNLRKYSEGQHYYKFVKENGAWKISWMQGHPVFESSEVINSATQLRNPACR
ncbi:MAG: nuclear transport factor 2 family protein [Gammaproteobacteria bacterium]|nr:nuclear transport factor 2 family protein [Gammaproteobacteria bacterium]